MSALDNSQVQPTNETSTQDNSPASNQPVAATDNTENEPNKNNIDELDMESMSIEDKDASRSSVVVHEDVENTEITQVNTDSLDELDCDPVEMIDLESEDIQVSISDGDKNNSYKTDTTFDEETPKASTMNMQVLSTHSVRLPAHNNQGFWLFQRQVGVLGHIPQARRL